MIGLSGVRWDPEGGTPFNHAIHRGFEDPVQRRLPDFRRAGDPSWLNRFHAEQVGLSSTLPCSVLCPDTRPSNRSPRGLSHTSATGFARETSNRVVTEEAVQSNLTAIKLSEMPPLLKLVFTLFLVMIGIAYLVSMFNLYLTYHLVDGQAGLTVEDLRRSFYGERNRTLLAAKIDGGSMEQYLPRPGDKEVILSWLQDGATEAGFMEVA